MFENRPKGRIQHCERCEVRLHFDWTKVRFRNARNTKNGPFWRILKNPKFTVKQCYQTGQFFKIGQKLVKNVKIGKNQMRHYFQNTVFGLGEYRILNSPFP